MTDTRNASPIEQRLDAYMEGLKNPDKAFGAYQYLAACLADEPTARSFLDLLIELAYCRGASDQLGADRAPVDADLVRKLGAQS